MFTHNSETHRRGRLYKREFFAQYLHEKPPRSRGYGISWDLLNRNIIGVGFGPKEVSGSGIGAPEALRVYVRKKMPRGRVPKAERIPLEINGLPTDVIQAGKTRLLQRPVQGGVSGAHPVALPGTLGCLVRLREAPQRRLVLSCNHVLAVSGRARLGDPTLEPARQDGGSSSTPIGTLRFFVTLQSNGNLMDCALTELLNPADFLPGLRFIGPINPSPLPAADHMTVKKSGRNSPYLTLGIVADVSADLLVPYPQGSIGFVNQIVIRGAGGPFANPGDSGALVVDAQTNRPVGMVFAGGEGITYVNPIGPILDKLKIEFVGS